MLAQFRDLNCWFQTNTGVFLDIQRVKSPQVTSVLSSLPKDMELEIALASFIVFLCLGFDLGLVWA